MLPTQQAAELSHDLNNRLVSLLNFLESTAQSTVDFGKEQAPLIFNELIAYATVRECMHVAFALLLILISIPIQIQGYGFFSKYGDDTPRPNCLTVSKYGDDTPSQLPDGVTSAKVVGSIIRAVIASIICFFSSIIFLTEVGDTYKPIFAPRIYAIEWVGHQINPHLRDAP